MLFLIGYSAIGGASAFGLIYWIYQRKVKKNSLTSTSFLIKMPPIIGLINIIMASTFMFLYVTDPSVFSADHTIASPIVYGLFTLFSLYFYAIAIPLSIGCTGIAIILYKKQHIGRKRYAISTTSNGIGAVLLGVLIYKILG